MTYAELQFILSEYKGFSDAEFKAGIEASINYWADAYGTSADASEVADYIAAVGTATAEKVAVQKYIDLWLNGTEAWTEIRRTGYPEQVLIISFNLRGSQRCIGRTRQVHSSLRSEG